MRLLEEARLALFFTRAASAGVGSFDGHIVVARHEVDFTAPLHWRPAPVLVNTWVSRIGGASFTLGYTIGEPDAAQKVYARATTVMVTFDPGPSRTRRLTEAERTFLENYLDPPSPVGSGSGQEPGAAVGGQ